MADYTTIDDPSAYFQVVLHSSNGSATITNDGNSDLQPDFIWSKARGQAYNHGLYDSTRGVTKFLSSNTDTDETTASSGFDLTSFNTDGFSTGNNQFNTICGNTTYVAWQWKANGGTTSSDTNGSITSTVQADTTAGFSIVSFTGNGTDGATVGHGLGVIPAMAIFKCRDTDNTDWRVYHQSISPTNAVSLNSTGAEYGASGVFGGTFTSTLLKVENDTGANRNTSPMIAYCFSEVQGYSKFGSYVGNGSGTSDGTFNGPMVYTGFKPAWVMVKASSASSGDGWNIFDNKRGPINYNQNKLYADSSAAESGAVYDAVDFLSNGFKIRTGRGGANTSGRTYIYMAFAENPFVTSTGIPTTAR